MHPFDRVIVVDWSAANQPSPVRPSADAIWIGEASATGETVTYHRTRAAAETALCLTLAGRDRVLVGFDFPMGYPAGFAARLTGTSSAKAVHGWLSDMITDRPDNRNNRFQVAARINAILGGMGPFWGCPASLRIADLGPRKPKDYAAIGLSERRQVEILVPKAQPVWKLYTAGSVGSQALMGQPLVRRLGLPVWPFDPPADRMVAEIYPSLLTPQVAREPGIKDAAQVRLLARALWQLSHGGRLTPLFDTPAIAEEEGWILGAGHAALLAQALTWG